MLQDLLEERKAFRRAGFSISRQVPSVWFKECFVLRMRVMSSFAELATSEGTSAINKKQSTSRGSASSS